MSSLARRAATLVGGNMIARIITLGLAPVVTRIFAPEAFGEFSAVLAVGMLLGAVCHLRYPCALMLPTEDDDLNGLTLISLLLPFLPALGLGAILLSTGDWLPRQLELTARPELIWFIPLIMLCTGWLFTLSQLCIRESLFRGLALSRISQALGNQGVGIGLGLSGLTTGLGLLLGRMAALIGALTAVGRTLGAARFGGIFSLPSWRRVVPMASRYKRFPLYSPTALLNQGTAQLPVVLLTSLFNPAVAGLYALSLRILREPLNLFGESLAQIYTHRASELYRDNLPLTDFTRKYMDTVMKTALVPLALLGIVSIDVFALIFGEQWRQTGTFVALLSPHYALILLAWPLSALFDIMEKLRTRLLFDATLFVMTISSLFVGYWLESPVLAIALFASSSIMVTLPKILWLARLGGLLPGEFFLLAQKRVLTALAIAAPTLVAKLFQAHVLLLLGSAFLSASAYYAWLYKTDEECANLLRRMRKRK